MASSSRASRHSRAISAKAAKKSGDAVTEDFEAPAEPEPVETEMAHPEAEAEKEHAAHEATSAAPAERGATASEQPQKQRDPRFHIFVIDSGWNSPASKVLRQNLAMIRDINEDDDVYVLNREMSVALLRHYPLQVGRDPIITVHDLHAKHRHRIKHIHGFRVHLGILDSEQQVLSAMQMLARFLVSHRTTRDLEKVIRQTFHREGIAGAIEIMGGHEHQKLIEE